MNLIQIISQLADLIKDRRSFLHGDKEYDEIFLKDIEALEFAIKILTEKYEKQYEYDYEGELE